MNRPVSLLLLLSATAAARPVVAEESAPTPVVQLYTVGQGDSLFERFGHAAMCLEQRGRPAETLCFNYGTTDFTTPGPLTWDFLRGQADFWVSTDSVEPMLAFYRARDRAVWRQDLPLSPAQARAASERLNHDIRPRLLHFTYHHFDDNCTTRLRDIIDEATGGALRPTKGQRAQATFRALARRGLAGETAPLLLSDLFVGREADGAIDRWQAMFLPEVLRQEVRQRLGAQPTLVIERRGPPFPQDPGRGGRGLLLLFALVLALLTLAARRASSRAWRRALVALVATPPGLLGLALWMLALISPLSEIRWNEGLLIFWPLDLAMPLLPRLWLRRYATLRVVVVALALALSLLGALRQPLLGQSLLVLLPAALLTLPPRHLGGLTRRRRR